MGVLLCPSPSVFPSAFAAPWERFRLWMCLVCRYLRGYKTALCRMKCLQHLLLLPMIQPCPLTTSRAVSPPPPPPPPPASFPFHRHQNVATGTLTLIQIFHGHLPRNDGGWKRKGLPKGGGRNVSVISLSGSHECAIIPNQNAAIAAQYFKRCLGFNAALLRPRY